MCLEYRDEHHAVDVASPNRSTSGALDITREAPNAMAVETIPTPVRSTRWVAVQHQQDRTRAFVHIVDAVPVELGESALEWEELLIPEFRRS